MCQQHAQQATRQNSCLHTSRHAQRRAAGRPPTQHTTNHLRVHNRPHVLVADLGPPPRAHAPPLNDRLSQLGHLGHIIQVCHIDALPRLPVLAGRRGCRRGGAQRRRAVRRRHQGRKAAAVTRRWEPCRRGSAPAAHSRRTPPAHPASRSTGWASPLQVCRYHLLPAACRRRWRQRPGGEGCHQTSGMPCCCCCCCCGGQAVPASAVAAEAALATLPGLFPWPLLRLLWVLAACPAPPPLARRQRRVAYGEPTIAPAARLQRHRARSWCCTCRQSARRRSVGP